MGRPAGSSNILGDTTKRSILSVYDGLGGAEAMLLWAKRNQTEFYKIVAALLPKNVDIDLTQRVINVNIGLNGRYQPQLTSEASDSVPESCN